MSKCTYIDGIASSQAIDTAGEVVDIAGLDCSSMDGAPLNWEHKSDTPAQIVGKIISFKKIFNEKDCENDRHAYYWKKCQMPFLYALGRLFDDKKDSSKEVAALFLDDAQNPDEKPMVGFSIEGAKIEKKGHVITNSIARKLTITNCPANKTCVAEMLQTENDDGKDDIDSIFKSEFLEIELFKAESMNPKKPSTTANNASNIKPPIANSSDTASLPSKSTNAGKKMGETRSGKEVFSHAKIHEYKGFTAADHSDAAKMHYDAVNNEKDHAVASHHRQKMNLHNQALRTQERKESRMATGKKIRTDIPLNKIKQSLLKTITAGSGNAAPGQLAGSEVLAKESIDKKIKKSKLGESKPNLGKKEWLARAELEYSQWPKKDKFREFMKKSMPNLTLGEIDALGQTIVLKKSIDAEAKLVKLIKQCKCQSSDCKCK